MTNAGIKLRTLAAADTTLQGYLGTAPFRWQERQLTPGYIQDGACVRVLRIGSPLAGFTHTGPSQIEEVQFQIDVLSLDPEEARTVAQAIDTFLQTVNLVSPTNRATVNAHPNFKLGQREGMDYQLKPPAYVEILMYRIYNSTTN